MLWLQLKLQMLPIIAVEINNRINEYNNKTAPLKDFYAAQKKLSEIEGTGTVENIAQKLITVIDNL